MERFRNIVLTICVLVLVLLLAGCKTVVSTNPIVGVTRSGRITVNSRITEPAKLKKSLKSVGYKSGDTIKISISKDTSQMFMMKVSKIFSAAGFPKVIFMKPQQASSFVKEDKKKP